MFILKKIWCRGFQAAFRAVLPLLPYREPKILSSCGELAKVFDGGTGKAVLIVTDEGIVKNRLLEPITRALEESNTAYRIYDKTQPNPTAENVEEALAIYREGGCEGLIAVGGGSSMDCAKATGARAVYPKKPLSKMGGVMKIRRRLPTLIAIPTTAGTGSEVTLAAVITDSRTKRKYALMSFPLIPHYAVLDAQMTYTLPPSLTATTGMDALTHAVEAYIGRSTSRETRALAKEATRLIFGNIEKAYSDGMDSEARENMLLAAYRAGIAFSKSYVGYVHAIAHSLGGAYGTPHGLANAVIMPYLLEGYGESVYKKLRELAVAAELATEEIGDREGAEIFIGAIRELQRKMNIPDKISGIKKEDIPTLAEHAEREANPLYPVPRLMTKYELAEFYYKFGENL